MLTTGAKLKDTGIYGKDWSFTDVAGNQVKVGQDGKSGKYQDKEGKQLNAYDIDNSNSTAVKLSSHTRGLLTLVTGGASGTNIDQVNGELTNAALGNKNIDSEEGYKYGVSNVRKMYADAGITRKDQALQLMNIAYNEKRLDHQTYIQTKNSLNEIFGKDTPNKSAFSIEAPSKPAYTEATQFSSIVEKNRAKYGRK